MHHLLLVVTCTVLLVAASATTVYEGYKVYNCLNASDGKMTQLLNYCERKHFDVWYASRVDGRAEIMVAPEDQPEFLAFLVQIDMRYETLIANVQRMIKYENLFSKLLYENEEEEISFNKYHSFPKISDYLRQMAAKYPLLASVETVGKSTEGRDLPVLKISRGGNNPVIWIDAGIHAREWIAPAMALYVINQLLEEPANAALLDGVDWHILPVVNPDGYHWSFTKDRFWRKTRSSTTCQLQSKAGVDANRNWDYKWQAASENDVCSETYSGPRPFSEPETVAMRDHLLAVKDRLKFYLSFHSFGPYIFTPWSWTSTPPPDWKTLRDLADRANAALMAAGGEFAQVGSPAELLYKVRGSSQDWARGVAGVNLSYTIELPGGGSMGFDLPPYKILSTVTAYFEGVRTFGEHVRTHFPPGKVG